MYRRVFAVAFVLLMLASTVTAAPDQVRDREGREAWTNPITSMVDTILGTIVAVFSGDQAQQAEGARGGERSQRPQGPHEAGQPVDEFGGGPEPSGSPPDEFGGGPEPNG